MAVCIVLRSHVGSSPVSCQLANWPGVVGFYYFVCGDELFFCGKQNNNGGGGRGTQLSSFSPPVLKSERSEASVAARGADYQVKTGTCVIDVYIVAGILVALELDDKRKDLTYKETYFCSQCEDIISLGKKPISYQNKNDRICSLSNTPTPAYTRRIPHHPQTRIKGFEVQFVRIPT